MNRLLYFSMVCAGLLLGRLDSRAAAPTDLLVDPSGGTTLSTVLTGDDDVIAGRPIGFPFTYYGGDPVNTIDVAVNGNLNFSKDGDYANRSMPSADTARINVLWNDLILLPLVGDSLVEKVEPGVYYSVTWTAHSVNDKTQKHVFQVVLFGAARRIGQLSFLPNDIVFSYKTLGAFNKDNATIGLDDGGGNFTTAPNLTAAGGLARSNDGTALLNGGGLLVFRASDDGYTVPNLTNHAPTAVDDAGYGNGPFTQSVLANDLDADGDPLFLDSVTQGTFGTVTANADNTVTYTPGAHFTGTDSFSYGVIDGNGGAATGKVVVMPFSVARGAYDGPLFPPPDPDTPDDPDAEESGHLKVVVVDGGSFTGTLTYPDTDPVVFQGQFNGAGRYSAAVPTSADDATQTVQVTLVLESQGGVNRVTGTVDDGMSPLVLVAPHSVNSAPVAHDDVVYLNGRHFVVIYPTQNDFDREGDALTVSANTQGKTGRVMRSEDHRTLTYFPDTPAAVDHFTYTAVDPSGLSSMAQITVYAFSNARGSYDGLIDGTDSDGNMVVDNTGRLHLAVAATGAFTASISYGGRAYVMRGAFTSVGDWQGMLNIPDGDPVMVKLHLDLTQDSHQVTGTISDADGNALSQISVGRSTYRARTFPAPQAGPLTLLPTLDDTGVPSTGGWVRAVVNAGGVVTLRGRWADGTVLAINALLQMDGTIPVYLARPARGTRLKGFVTGTLSFADPLAKSALSGLLTWWMPASDDGTYDESTVEMDLAGGAYVRPGTGEGILNLPPPPVNAQIDLDDVTVLVSIGADHKVIVDPSDTHRLKVTLAPATGAFSGSYYEDDPDSDTGKQILRKFTGLLLRQENRGSGVILRPHGDAGVVTIHAIVAGAQ